MSAGTFPHLRLGITGAGILVSGHLHRSAHQVSGRNDGSDACARVQRPFSDDERSIGCRFLAEVAHRFSRFAVLACCSPRSCSLPPSGGAVRL